MHITRGVGIITLDRAWYPIWLCIHIGRWATILVGIGITTPSIIIAILALLVVIVIILTVGVSSPPARILHSTTRAVNMAALSMSRLGRLTSLMIVHIHCPWPHRRRWGHGLRPMLLLSVVLDVT